MRGPVRPDGQTAPLTVTLRIASSCAHHCRRGTSPAAGDDVGSADVGYNGQLAADFAVKTPTLDKLSAAGVKLSAHYVRNWCAPTRAMIMTSRYELHFAQTGGGGTGHTNGVPVNFTLLPEALRRANYTSYGFGKWQ